MQTNDKKDFYWLNEKSETFLERGYLLDGVTPKQRIKQIADHAEQKLGIAGFSDKFYKYMSRGYYSLASPVWANYGLDRGLPISCLTGDSWINTENEGGKKIKDIEKGDKVLTHKGRYKKVIAKQVQQSNDNLYELKVKTRMTPIRITGNHKIKTNRGWVRVDELNDKNDYIATNNNIEWDWDVYAIKLEHKKQNDRYPTRFKEKDISGDYIVDEKLAWALGLWFAEGSLSRNQSSSPNGIRITMGLEYRDSIERWASIFEEKFNVNSTIYEGETTREGKKYKWLNCNINSGSLGRFFEDNFGKNCKTKIIPEGLNSMRKSRLKKFLDGFYLGDGQKTHNQESFTISNPKLALSLYEIGLKCDYKMGLQMQQKSGKLSTTKYVYKVNIYCNRGRNLSRNNCYSGIEFYDGLRYAPFSLTKLNYNEKVYDITVEDDHSFSVAGVVVHNCFNSHIEDTMESILFTHAEVGMMTKVGGGTSGYFGDLRGRGEPVTNNGSSNGSYAFAKLFDREMDVISQGSTRRGFFAGYIDIEHKDIDEWLNIQHEGDEIQGMMYGVCVGDEWMQQMIDGDQDKRKTWAKVLQNRIDLGVPYIFFRDTVNNNAPQVYKDRGRSINSSNLCVTGDQRVISDRGIKTAKQLNEEGGKLILFDNKKKVNASPMKLIKKDAPVYKITLENGMTHTITEDHKLPVFKNSPQRTAPENYKYKTKRINIYEDTKCKNLNIGDKIKIQTKKGLYGNKNMPEEAFLLGMYQSDGTQHKDRIMLDVWENDFDLLNEVQECFNKIHYKYKCDTYEINHPSGKKVIRKCEPAQFYNCTVMQSDVKKKRLSSRTLKKSLNFEKGYIPDWIWESNEKTQWQYVRGLLFADGTVHVSSNSKGKPIQINYADINKDFLQELQILFNNLGLQSSIRLLREGGKTLLPDGKGGHKKYNTKDCYRLIVGNKNDALRIEENTNFLSRKNISIEKRKYRNNTKKHYKIKSIEYVGREDVYCCKVDSDEHHWICNGFVTHNCSEIALSSNENESFVCCLSSMNLAQYDEWKNTDAVEVLTYFLDSVMQEFIDKVEGMQFMERTVEFAKNQRAIGIGALGWHSYLQSQNIAFDSFESMQKNNEIFKTISERSRQASQELADLFGEPPMLEGYGRRNVTTMAVAPTKSSSFILGQVSPSIEPIKSNYFVRDRAKIKTTYKNPHLKNILQEQGKDTKQVWESIALNDGSVQHLDFLTDHQKDVFKTFKELSQMSIVNQAAQRQKHIDQSQSLNLAIDPDNTPVKDINKLYIEAWKKGVKTLYYQHSVNSAQEFSRNLLSCSSCEG